MARCVNRKKCFCFECAITYCWRNKRLWFPLPRTSESKRFYQSKLSLWAKSELYFLKPLIQSLFVICLFLNEESFCTSMQCGAFHATLLFKWIRSEADILKQFLLLLAFQCMIYCKCSKIYVIFFTAPKVFWDILPKQFSPTSLQQHEGSYKQTSSYDWGLQWIVCLRAKFFQSVSDLQWSLLCYCQNISLEQNKICRGYMTPKMRYSPLFHTSF